MAHVHHAALHMTVTVDEAGAEDAAGQIHLPLAPVGTVAQNPPLTNADVSFYQGAGEDIHHQPVLKDQIGGDTAPGHVQ